MYTANKKVKLNEMNKQQKQIQNIFEFSLKKYNKYSSETSNSKWDILSYERKINDACDQVWIRVCMDIYTFICVHCNCICMYFET